MASLEDLGALYGAKVIVVARELTKKFEEAIRGSAKEIIESLKKQKPRGEFVIVI